MSNINAISATPATDYTERTEVTGTGTATASGQDFSSVFADAIRDGMVQTSVTTGGGFPGMPVGFMPPQNDGIEQAILNAASSGQVDDAQVALFMLCMMMQGNQEGEFSMLMSMMATMLMQIQGDKNTLRDNMIDAGFEPFVLDTMDRELFGWRMPDGSGMGQVRLPLEFWRPTTPAVTSVEGNRSPELYRSVIDQFRVERAERYKPFREGNTYCNIFVWDVTSAMGAEIPHYTDPATGEPRYYPDIRGARSMGATATCEWLRTHGQTYGWREVDAETAQMHANQGKPAMTSAGSLGHVQIICPSRDGGFDPVRGVTIAQAGSRVTNYSHISSIYSANALNNNVRYWIHE